MITNFPEIHPDELVYSWFSRYHVHSGYLNHNETLKDLYCKRSDNPSKELIGNLNPEAKAQITAMYPLHDLILLHTMYPQYARFLPCIQKWETYNHLKNDTCDAHYLFSSILRHPGEEFLKYCPLCVQADRKKYGESYWHRKHQIRNVDICPTHRCRLIMSNVSAKTYNTFTLDALEHHIKSMEIVIDENKIKEIYIDYISSVFDAPIDLNVFISAKSALYKGMKCKNYLDKSGGREIKKLFEDMHAFYKNISIKNIATFYQIQRVLSGQRFDFSVICQIAFFLKISIEDLFSPSEDDYKEIYGKKQDCPKNWNYYDEEMASKVQNVAKMIYSGQLNCNGKVERVSEKRLCAVMGMPINRLKHMPKCQEILKEYAESYNEYWAREIIWAYKKLKQERNRDIVYWSDIRRVTGIKKHNACLSIPYLERYSNSVMANTIRDIIES